MTPTTRVSLALLWERCQEIEELPEHDKTVLAELNVLEARIIDQPAKNARDLVAKLKFLAQSLAITTGTTSSKSSTPRSCRLRRTSFVPRKVRLTGFHKRSDISKA